jgi:hypothetical protein
MKDYYISKARHCRKKAKSMPPREAKYLLRFAAAFEAAAVKRQD